MKEEYRHVPVLPEQTLELLLPQENGPLRILDGTVGFGGHSSLILKRNPEAEILGIDRDGMALEAAKENLSFASGRVHLMRSRFSDLAECAAALGWEKVDGVLLDIGVSSPQLDNPGRGFSFRSDAALDMRMDQRSELTASRIVNEYPESALAQILREYGEIRESGRLAAAIARERAKAPVETTRRLAEICERVLSPRGGAMRGGDVRRRRNALPAPTLVFQALRIAVNDELNELRKALNAALELLNPGGRLAVISFHSLEDRIVKQFFHEMAQTCKCPPKCPVCICNWHRKLKILTGKPVMADEAEIRSNPRSACAKLRAAEKVADFSRPAPENGDGGKPHQKTKNQSMKQQKIGRI